MLKHHTQTVGSEMWYIKTLQCQVIFPTFCSSCSMCHDWAHQCKGMSLHLQPITYFSCCTVSHEYWRNILLQYSALYLDFLLKCNFDAKVDIVHLCWHKQLEKTSIINYISSLLSQFWTVIPWNIHICWETLGHIIHIYVNSHLPIAHKLLGDILYSEL